MPERTVLKLFSKSLTETDTRKRLAIPTKILPHLPDFKESHAVKFQLIYGYGTKKWPIFCTIRKKGYKKPVFSHGWRRYVLCNDLNVGDQVTFYKVQDETDNSLYYRIDVEKPARRILPEALSSFTTPHEVDEGTITRRLINFEHHNQLPHHPTAPVEEEEGVKKLSIADIVAAGPVLSFDQVVAKAKPPSRIFHGTSAIDEAATKAHITAASLYGISGIGNVPPPNAYLMSKKEIEINPFGFALGDALFHGSDGTSQAARQAANDKNTTTKLSLDLVLGQSISFGEAPLNLDLTLALPSYD